MPVKFQNFSYSFMRRGKPVFVPNPFGERVGLDVKQRVEALKQFDDIYYHVKPGGHEAALHAHRPNLYFARLDIENFFYGIGRNRIARALKAIGVERAVNYAKWSTVKNPFQNPSYALPYGFIQSPILATAVLDQSALGEVLRAQSKHITVAVYVDDISISSNNLQELQQTFELIRSVLNQAGFSLNLQKTVEPGEMMQIFNCDLRCNVSVVSLARINTFNEEDRSQLSKEAFDRYVNLVAIGNDANF